MLLEKVDKRDTNLKRHHFTLIPGKLLLLSFLHSPMQHMYYYIIIQLNTLCLRGLLNYLLASLLVIEV